MKKILLLMIAIILFSGCSIKNIKEDRLTIIDTIFKENNLSNITSPGYKYYIPNGVSLIGRTEYNETLYSQGDRYYLYADVVSYYNKVDIEYVENNNAYFSKKLEYKDKKGYIEITKLKDNYFVEIMYNYAKIEAYVDENNIDKTILNSGYILSSLKFNDLLAETKLGTTEETKNEEKLNIFVPKREEGSFLDSLDQPETDEVGKEE